MYVLLFVITYRHLFYVLFIYITQTYTIFPGIDYDFHLLLNEIIHININFNKNTVNVT